jgi:hypothetical protein
MQSKRFGKSKTLVLHTCEAFSHGPAGKWLIHKSRRPKPFHCRRPSVAFGFASDSFLVDHPVHLDDFAGAFKRQVTVIRMIATFERQKSPDGGRHFSRYIFNVGPIAKEA